MAPHRWLLALLGLTTAAADWQVVTNRRVVAGELSAADDQVTPTRQTADNCTDGVQDRPLPGCLDAAGERHAHGDVWMERPALLRGGSCVRRVLGCLRGQLVQPVPDRRERCVADVSGATNAACMMDSFFTCCPVFDCRAKLATLVSPAAWVHPPNNTAVQQFLTRVNISELYDTRVPPVPVAQPRLTSASLNDLLQALGERPPPLTQPERDVARELRAILRVMGDSAPSRAAPVLPELPGVPGMDELLALVASLRDRLQPGWVPDEVRAVLRLLVGHEPARQAVIHRLLLLLLTHVDDGRLPATASADALLQHVRTLLRRGQLSVRISESDLAALKALLLKVEQTSPHQSIPYMLRYITSFYSSDGAGAGSFYVPGEASATGSQDPTLSDLFKELFGFQFSTGSGDPLTGGVTVDDFGWPPLEPFAPPPAGVMGPFPDLQTPSPVPAIDPNGPPPSVFVSVTGPAGPANSLRPGQECAQEDHAWATMSAVVDGRCTRRVLGCRHGRVVSSPALIERREVCRSRDRLQPPLCRVQSFFTCCPVYDCREKLLLLTTADRPVSDDGLTVFEFLREVDQHQLKEVRSPVPIVERTLHVQTVAEMRSKLTNTTQDRRVLHELDHILRLFSRDDSAPPQPTATSAAATPPPLTMEQLTTKLGAITRVLADAGFSVDPDLVRELRQVRVTLVMLEQKLSNGVDTPELPTNIAAVIAQLLKEITKPFSGRTTHPVVAFTSDMELLRLAAKASRPSGGDALLTKHELKKLVHELVRVIDEWLVVVEHDVMGESATEPSTHPDMSSWKDFADLLRRLFGRHSLLPDTIGVDVTAISDSRHPSGPEGELMTVVMRLLHKLDETEDVASPDVRQMLLDLMQRLDQVDIIMSAKVRPLMVLLVEQLRQTPGRATPEVRQLLVNLLQQIALTDDTTTPEAIQFLVEFLGDVQMGRKSDIDLFRLVLALLERPHQGDGPDLDGMTLQDTLIRLFGRGSYSPNTHATDGSDYQRPVGSEGEMVTVLIDLLQMLGPARDASSPAVRQILLDVIQRLDHVDISTSADVRPMVVLLIQQIGQTPGPATPEVRQLLVKLLQQLSLTDDTTTPEVMHFLLQFTMDGNAGQKSESDLIKLVLALLERQDIGKRPGPGEVPLKDMLIRLFDQGHFSPGTDITIVNGGQRPSEHEGELMAVVMRLLRKLHQTRDASSPDVRRMLVELIQRLNQVDIGVSTVVRPLILFLVQQLGQSPVRTVPVVRQLLVKLLQQMALTDDTTTPETIQFLVEFLGDVQLGRKSDIDLFRLVLALLERPHQGDTSGPVGLEDTLIRLFGQGPFPSDVKTVDVTLTSDGQQPSGSELELITVVMRLLQMLGQRRDTSSPDFRQLVIELIEHLRNAQEFSFPKFQEIMVLLVQQLGQAPTTAVPEVRQLLVELLHRLSRTDATATPQVKRVLVELAMGTERDRVPNNEIMRLVLMLLERQSHRHPSGVQGFNISAFVADDGQKDFTDIQYLLQLLLSRMDAVNNVPDSPEFFNITGILPHNPPDNLQDIQDLLQLIWHQTRTRPNTPGFFNISAVIGTNGGNNFTEIQHVLDVLLSRIEAESNKPQTPSIFNISAVLPSSDRNSMDGMQVLLQEILSRIERVNKPTSPGFFNISGVLTNERQNDFGDIRDVLQLIMSEMETADEAQRNTGYFNISGVLVNEKNTNFDNIRRQIELIMAQFETEKNKPHLPGFFNISGIVVNEPRNDFKDIRYLLELISSRMGTASEVAYSPGFFNISGVLTNEDGNDFNTIQQMLELMVAQMGRHDQTVSPGYIDVSAVNGDEKSNDGTRNLLPLLLYALTSKSTIPQLSSYFNISGVLRDNPKSFGNVRYLLELMISQLMEGSNISHEQQAAVMEMIISLFGNEDNQPDSKDFDLQNIISMFTTSADDTNVFSLNSFMNLLLSLNTPKNDQYIREDLGKLVIFLQDHSQSQIDPNELVQLIMRLFHPLEASENPSGVTLPMVIKFVMRQIEGHPVRPDDHLDELRWLLSRFEGGQEASSVSQTGTVQINTSYPNVYGFHWTAPSLGSVISSQQARPFSRVGGSPAVEVFNITGFDQSHTSSVNYRPIDLGNDHINISRLFDFLEPVHVHKRPETVTNFNVPSGPHEPSRGSGGIFVSGGGANSHHSESDFRLGPAPNDVEPDLLALLVRLQQDQKSPLLEMLPKLIQAITLTLREAPQPRGDVLPYVIRLVTRLLGRKASQPDHILVPQILMRLHGATDPRPDVLADVLPLLQRLLRLEEQRQTPVGTGQVSFTVHGPDHTGGQERDLLKLFNMFFSPGRVEKGIVTSDTAVASSPEHEVLPNFVTALLQLERKRKENLPLHDNLPQIINVLRLALDQQSSQIGPDALRYTIELIMSLLRSGTARSAPSLLQNIMLQLQKQIRNPQVMRWSRIIQMLQVLLQLEKQRTSRPFGTTLVIRGDRQPEESANDLLAPEVIAAILYLEDSRDKGRPFAELLPKMVALLRAAVGLEGPRTRSGIADHIFHLVKSLFEKEVLRPTPEQHSATVPDILKFIYDNEVSDRIGFFMDLLPMLELLMLVRQQGGHDFLQVPDNLHIPGHTGDVSVQELLQYLITHSGSKPDAPAGLAKWMHILLNYERKITSENGDVTAFRTGITEEHMNLVARNNSDNNLEEFLKLFMMGLNSLSSGGTDHYHSKNMVAQLVDLIRAQAGKDNDFISRSDTHHLLLLLTGQQIGLHHVSLEAYRTALFLFTGEHGDPTATREDMFMTLAQLVSDTAPTSASQSQPEPAVVYCRLLTLLTGHSVQSSAPADALHHALMLLLAGPAGANPNGESEDTIHILLELLAAVSGSGSDGVHEHLIKMLLTVLNGMTLNTHVEHHEDFIRVFLGTLGNVFGENNGSVSDLIRLLLDMPGGVPGIVPSHMPGSLGRILLTMLNSRTGENHSGHVMDLLRLVLKLSADMSDGVDSSPEPLYQLLALLASRPNGLPRTVSHGLYRCLLSLLGEHQFDAGSVPDHLYGRLVPLLAGDRFDVTAVADDTLSSLIGLMDDRQTGVTSELLLRRLLLLLADRSTQPAMAGLHRTDPHLLVHRCRLLCRAALGRQSGHMRQLAGQPGTSVTFVGENNVFVLN